MVKNISIAAEKDLEDWEVYDELKGRQGRRVKELQKKDSSMNIEVS